MVPCRCTLVFVLVVTAFLSVAAPTPARAQEDVAEHARVLFTEGVALADRGDWVTAIDRFERALALHDAPTIHYNLAQSLFHVGRLVESLGHLDALERGDAPAALRASSETLRAEIEPRIGRIVVRLRGEGADACVVEVGEQTLEASMLGEPIPVDPGPARVRLLCDRTIVDQVDVSIPEGGSSHVVLATVPVPSHPGVLGPGDESTPRPVSGDVTGEAWFWVVIGVAIAGVAAGVTAGVVVSTAPQPTQGNFTMPILEFGP